MLKTMADYYEVPLKRLVSLCGTDEGFYVLALHSFVEGFSNRIRDGYSFYANFPDVIDLLTEYLEKHGRLTNAYRKALVRMAKEHGLANRVRHQFQTVTRDEAEASTANFLLFCEAFHVEAPALADLNNSVKLFGKAKSGAEMIRELEKTQKRLAEKEEREAILLAKAARYDEMEAALAGLSGKEAEFRAELARLRQAVDSKDSRADELRRALFDVTKEKNLILKELEGYRDIGDYLQFLERFSSFTRTRLDYERSVMKLTPEQESAVDMMRDSGDYIVKGGAGTGKTLVLLHALERYAGGKQDSLGLAANRKALLLTYTNTLVKYSKYLAHVVGKGNDNIAISTADSQVLAALKTALPGAWIDFKAPKAMIADYNATSFLSDDELAAEIEDVIWGNLVSREEYLEKHILRRGMKQPLNTQQRQLVWSIQEKLRADLAGAKRFSPNLACSFILERLAGDPAVLATMACDRVFVDEGQDLSTATIRCLKAISRSGIVLAADDGQSIFRIGSQYLRASLATAGHVRTLRANFRNTRQIHEFAERFLASGAPASEDERASSGLREGPSPQLITAKDENGLLAAAMDYVKLAVGRLGYDPENIGILAPTKRLLEKARASLAGAGFDSAVIKDDAFDFEVPGIVRLSTLHSSKGIEFPVVMLLLPSIQTEGNFDEKATSAMQRNLLYVGLTRAMDHVVVFTLDSPQEQVVRELVDLSRSNIGVAEAALQ
jgi:superfamily I DNA/RNA helicase